MAGSTGLNVFQKPLTLFSRTPMTGFYRDGYCRTGPEDGGNHAVAGVLTKEFLDFTVSRGNNLRAAGLTPGCKWCLCASRWLEAVDAVRAGEVPSGEKAVPQVDLHATDQSALRKIDLDVLKKYALTNEQAGTGQANGADAREL